MKDSLNEEKFHKLEKFLDNQFSKEKSVYGVYQKLATSFDVNINCNESDSQLFKKLKNIIINLVKVKPVERMMLKDVRKELEQLKIWTKNVEMEKSLLLNSFLCLECPANEYEPSQYSFGLMSEARTSQIITATFEDDDYHLTQRDTNLCVSFSAVILLSYALVDFFGESRIFEHEKQLQNLGKRTVENPKFIKQLLDVCCGVISPRSLNGLNHSRLDNHSQIEAQLQDISKLNKSKYEIYLKMAQNCCDRDRTT